MKLDQYLSETSETHTEFAKRVGVSAETVRRYLAGERIPNKKMMSRIALMTGCRVTANDFFGILAADEAA
jgi:transcriptional regulator with XRE-family HTH domain